MLDLLPSFGAITWWRSVPSIRYAGSGNSVQGIGWALNEYYDIDIQGIMKNNTLLDYRMPISLDLPMIDTEII